MTGIEDSSKHMSISTSVKTLCRSICTGIYVYMQTVLEHIRMLVTIIGGSVTLGTGV